MLDGCLARGHGLGAMLGYHDTAPTSQRNGDYPRRTARRLFDHDVGLLPSFDHGFGVDGPSLRAE